MKRLGMVAMLGLLAVLAAGCMGSPDTSSRKAAIGSSTPSTTDMSITSTNLNGGRPIKVESWNWGVSNTTTIGGATGGATSGKASPGDFNIVKNIDEASPGILTAVGRSTNLGTLTFTVGSSKPPLTYTFTTVFATSLAHSGSGIATGSEKVTFKYGKVAVNTVIIDPTGVAKNSTACWDFIGNLQC